VVAELVENQQTLAVLVVVVQVQWWSIPRSV
jgi:hypothetical protein